MNTPTLAEADWETVFESDEGMSAVIVNCDGDIVFGSRGAYRIFGIDPSSDVVGKQLDDLFHPEFVRERKNWICTVAREREPIVVRHIYQGRSIVSTLTPLGSPPDRPHVLVVSRMASPADPPSELPSVESELIDLGPLEKLSERELEVLVLLGHGRSVPQAAGLLHRSPRTIERHKEEIGRKLGASTIAQIVRLVSSLGLNLDHLGLKRYHALKTEFAGNLRAQIT